MLEFVPGWQAHAVATPLGGRMADLGGQRQNTSCPCDRGREVKSLEAHVSRLEADLRCSRTLASQTERLGRIGCWMLNLDTQSLTWSDGVYHIFGLSPDQPITLPHAMALYPQSEQVELKRVIEGAIVSGQPFDIITRYRTASDTDCWVRSIGQIEVGFDGTRSLIGMVREVTAERCIEDRLRHLATHDPLTGLANRRLFLETLEHVIPTARDEGGSMLVLLDVDHFKEVNDTHGHGAGDALLIEIARRLRAAVRAQDMVARLGGDEFALLLHGADSAPERLTVLLALFDHPAELTCGPLKIGVSLGAARLPRGKTTPIELLRRADIALYQAKGLGRNQACVFRRSMGVAVEERLGLLEEVRLALRHNELDVFYQPIIDLRTSIVRGMEALVRWHHPVRGLLAPGAFKAALADPTLSAEIGSFVLGRSLRQMRSWIDCGLPVTCVNVNLSESQLQHGDDLFRQVAGLLKANGLAPDRLKLEILEGVFLGRQKNSIVRTLARLQRFGVVVALDDFGTGYASLTHVREFDVGRIKIDRSFIREICTDPSNLAITRSIIDLGSNLGIRVVAEGIEEITQLAVLLRLKCDCGQGYLFNRPMPAEAVPAFYSRWEHEGTALLAAAEALETGLGPTAYSRVKVAMKEDEGRRLLQISRPRQRPGERGTMPRLGADISASSQV